MKNKWHTGELSSLRTPNGLLLGLLFCGQVMGPVLAAEPAQSVPDFSPPREEHQVPKQMHSAMKVLPRLKVGRADADIVGADNRALQAAVDYIASLGGGTVEIGPGEYLMRDH